MINKPIKITLALPPEMDDALRDAHSAWFSDCSRSEMIRVLIETGLRAKKEEEVPLSAERREMLKRIYTRLREID